MREDTTIATLRRGKILKQAVAQKQAEILGKVLRKRLLLCGQMKNGVGKIRFAAIGKRVNAHRHFTKFCYFFAVFIENIFLNLARFIFIGIVIQFPDAIAQKLLHILQRNGGNVRITVRTVLRDEQIDVVDTLILIRIDDLILIGAGRGKIIRDSLLGIGNTATTG